MKKCRITVMRISRYEDLMERYENPQTDACFMKEGQVFIADGWKKPEGMCDSAWESMSAFVMTLAHGNPKSAMISCNDGFRPVSFLIEALDEEACAADRTDTEPEQKPGRNQSESKEQYL